MFNVPWSLGLEGGEPERRTMRLQIARLPSRTADLCTLRTVPFEQCLE